MRPWRVVREHLLARVWRFVLLLGLSLALSARASADDALDGPRVEASASQPLAGTAPPDAPRVGGGRLAPTPPPPGFNVFDGGWIRFYYHPSIRERVQPLIE